VWIVRLGDYGDIDITVSPAESAMGEAAHEVESEQFGPELRLPEWHKAIGKTNRSNADGIISCSMHGTVARRLLWQR
jgi:hypothetical protein